MAKLVSKVYGEALLELAVEEKKVDVFMEEIEGIKNVLAGNVEFGRFMNHPQILKEDKISVLEAVFRGRISDELMGFLTLAAVKDRFGEIEDILSYFLTEIKKFKGIGVADVTTASVLSDEQRAKIERRLLETTSFKKMEMHYAEDESLIGGIVIRIGDRVVDSSVKTKLSELTKQLLRIQLS